MKGVLLLILLGCVGLLQAQQATVVVKNELGESLPFVDILSSESQLVASSDENGNAQFLIDCGIKYYVINYFGYDDYVLTLDCHQDHETTITLQPSVISLKTINIIGVDRHSQTSKPYQVTTIDKQRLKEFQSQTTVEALEQSGSAYIQRSQMGGGSPILRGFEANKILLVIDGVRMNNAIYRSGHSQNAISVDQAILENISTLYGPGSILFGSDALGGVVHFQTLRPKFSSSSKPRVSGGSYLRFASANEERSGHVHLNIAGKSIASLTSFTHSKYDDLKSGKKHPNKYPNFGKRPFYVDPSTDEIILNLDPEKQIFTGYDQTDLVQKLTHRFDDQKFIGLNIQYSTSSDVPRYDELTIVDGNGIPETAEWYYGPQDRFLAALRFDHETSSLFFDRYQSQFSYQHINEGRNSRAYRDGDLIVNNESVDVYAGNLDFYKKLRNDDTHELSYGLEYRYNQVNSSAHRRNKETNVVSYDVFTRYPSGQSDMFDAGGYLLYQFKKEKLTAQAGFRLNWNKLDVIYNRDDFFEWPEFFYTGLSQSATSLTWLAGLNYKMGEKMNIRLFSGTAFRAPNVDDFAKVRVKTSSSISIPNTNLSPEKTWNIETGIQQTIQPDGGEFPLIHLGLTAYYTSISNAIVRRDFALPNGDSTFNYNGNELRVQANVNATSGYITGISFQTQIGISKQISLDASVSWQRGSAKDSGKTEPLAHIPPLYGHASLTYKKQKWETTLSTTFNGKKTLDNYAPGSSDNEEFATAEGSLAWATMNLHFNYQLFKQLELKGGIENIFDLHYRTFSSGLSAPGRNIKLGLYASF